MPAILLCFKIHIPYRLSVDVAEDCNNGSGYFNDEATAAVVNQLADKCYLPANAIIARQMEELGGKFKIAFSISGTAIELLQAFRPDVIDSFKSLLATGCVELMAETYYNSLSWLYSKKEFQRQVEKHRRLIRDVFGIEPTVLRNTELIYNNELAAAAAGMGFKGVLCEGLEKILKGRTPNNLYTSPGTGEIKLLLRNRQLSDDIAFRFDAVQWNEHPLTAVKYAGWIHAHQQASAITLLIDYETFGIHKKTSTGILRFLEELPSAIISDQNWYFGTPSETLAAQEFCDVYDTPKTISWNDQDIASCVWCENSMQNNMLKKIYSMESLLKKSRNQDDLHCWGKLQGADHFYYMSGTGRTAEDAYQMRNPFSSPEAAYKNYLDIITRFEIKLIKEQLLQYKEHHPTYHTSLY